MLGLLLELAVTNRTRLTRTRHVADRATRRDLLDAATMRGRRYYVKSNMTQQIGEGEIDMLVQEKYVLSRRQRLANQSELETEKGSSRIKVAYGASSPQVLRHPVMLVCGFGHVAA